MHPAEWSEVRAAFEASLDLPTQDRTPFLRSQLGSRQDLLGAAEAMLAAAGEVDGFLERPLLEASSPPVEPLPDRLGTYRVLRLLGEGGMGRVYLVDRPDQDFLPAVALKVIKADLAGSGALERFHTERRILGTLDHPHIARVLDGGLTEAGLPYFVMEHVDGLRIDSYVRDRALARREAVDLFLRVCRAVAFAHQHLVIHCDLKPSNILVTVDGTPKLLDFGVARLMREQQPQNGGVALTPQFASPEQIRGQEITTASDVFSLGLLLARLFTAPILQDTTSFSPGSSPQGVSTIHSSDLRQLPKDLAAILGKCLQDAPLARYSSVDQLIADLDRHLTGHPVSARKLTLSYRARRFFQRNRGPVFAGAALVLAIVAGTITTVRQTVVARRERQRAEARAEELRALASSLLLDMDESLRELAGAEPAREQLLVKAYEHLAHLQDSNSLPQLADLHDQIGDILRSRYGVGEGDPQEAFDRFQQALRIREQLLAGSPASMPLRERVAQSHWRIARTLGQLGRHQEHLERARLAVSLQEGLLLRNPGRQDLERQLARYLQTLGTAELDQAQLPQAQACFERVLSIRRATLPGNQAIRSDLGSALRNLALAHFYNAEWREAVVLLEEALTISRDMQRLEPRNLRVQNDLQLTHLRMGRTLSKLGRPEALVRGHFLESVRLHEALVKANPRNVEIRLRGAEAYRFFGLHLFQHRRFREAQVQLRRSLRILEDWGDHPPSNIHFSVALAHASQDLAKVEDALVPGQGQPRRKRALAILEGLLATQRLAPRYLATVTDIRQECEAAD